MEPEVESAEPAAEDGPKPVVVQRGAPVEMRSRSRRLIHWVGFLGLTVILLITGAGLYFPDAVGFLPRITNSFLHYISGVVISLLAAGWLYVVVIWGGEKEWKDLAVSRIVARGFGRQSLYYLSPRRPPAEFRYHNPVQAWLYYLMAVALFGLAATGLTMWSSDGVFGRAVENTFGATAAPGLHLIGAATFLGLVLIHIYIMVLDLLITKNRALSSITLRPSSGGDSDSEASRASTIRSREGD